MGVKIRRNIFETNSSSTHSICVTQTDLLDQLRDEIVFRVGEFGWEYEKYNDPETKASYLYTAILEMGREDLLSNIRSILKRKGIECIFEEPKYVIDNNGYKYLDYGYIDHVYALDDFINICYDDDKLLKYLFSSQSFIITGNDNDDYDVEINVSYPHEEYYKGN